MLEPNCDEPQRLVTRPAIRGFRYRCLKGNQLSSLFGGIGVPIRFL